jgi:hypothetical protein
VERGATLIFIGVTVKKVDTGGLCVVGDILNERMDFGLQSPPWLHCGVMQVSTLGNSCLL